MPKLGGVPVAWVLLAGSVAAQPAGERPAHIREVYVASPDLFLAYWGRPTRGKGPFDGDDPVLFFHLLGLPFEGEMADLGRIRVREVEPAPDPVRTFTVRVRFRPGPPDPLRTARDLREMERPLLGFLGRSERDPSCGAAVPPHRIAVAPESVEIAVLKRPEEGPDRDVILRLREIAGRPVAKAVLTWGAPVAAALRCDLLERPLEAGAALVVKPDGAGSSTVEIPELPAYGTVTVRLRGGGK